MILILIFLIVVGAATGTCLYRFYQNGWVPKKYLEHPQAASEKKYRTAAGSKQLIGSYL